MGFLLCLVLGKSQLTLLLWRNYFGLGRDLVALERLLVVCLRPAQALCVPVLSFLQVWLGVTAAPLVPSYTPAQRNWVSTGHMWSVTPCQPVFPGISLCFKQLSWNSVSRHFLIISRKLHFACCRWVSTLVAEGILVLSSELTFLEPELEWFHAWCCHRIRLSAWVLQCYLHPTLVVICDKEFLG